jgi:hypothetical protein
MELWDSQLIGEISGAIIPIFLLIPLALWSDRKESRKLLMFIPIVGGILASLGEKKAII